MTQGKRTRIQEIQKNAPDFSVADEEKENLPKFLNGDIYDDFQLDLKEPKKKIGRGRPKLPKEEKLPTKPFTVRLSGDHLETLECMEGDTGTEKIKELIQDYVDLKNAINNQINHFRSIIFSAKKLFYSLDISREVFKHKVQYPLTMDSEKEKETVLSILEYVKKATSYLRLFGLSDDFLKKELGNQDFDFLIWLRNPL